MYGGRGVWPSRSNCSLILCWSCDTNRSVRKPSSPRARTSASSSPAPKRMRSPTRILRPGRTNASQVWGSSWRVKKISTFPVRCSDRVARDGGCECTPARFPSKRAGMTRALLRTRSSSPRSRRGSSAKNRSSKAPDEPSSSKSRDASRWSKGRWAICSRGRW